MSQEPDYGYGFNLQLAISNREIHLQGISSIESIRMQEMMFDWKSGITPPDIDFYIQAVVPRVRFQVQSTMSLQTSFASVDFTPSARTYDEIDLDTLLPFTPKKPQDIIIDPKEIDMWLGKLLEAQKPQQKEIRSRSHLANIIVQA